MIKASSYPGIVIDKSLMPIKITIESPDEPSLEKTLKLVELIHIVMRKLDTQPRKSPLKWTASQVALVELIYALHASDVFHQGPPDIRQIAETLAQAFNIPVPNSYRSFQDILARQTSPTLFLDTLKKNLERHIHEMSA